MSDTLDVVCNQRRFRFYSDLTLEELDAMEAVKKRGTWESQSGEHENELSFQFEDEPRTSLAAAYTFNDDNQLVVRIRQQAGVAQDSAEWPLRGQIVVDDEQDILYMLVDENGKVTDKKMYVYGALDFPDTSRLRIKFADGGEAFIGGNRDRQSLQASEYFAGGELARDLLRFHADTVNEIHGQELSLPATIQFVGQWELLDGRMALITHFDSTGATPRAYIAIAGKFKGTEAGLILEEDGEIAFQIHGRYSWNGSNLNWGLTLGYTPGNLLTGQLKVQGNIKGKNGDLTINGDLTLQGKHDALKVKFSLGLTYEAKWGSLVFTAKGSAGEYQIFFGGTVKIKGGQVTFSVKAASNGSVEADFGMLTKNSNLEISLRTILGREGLSLKLKMKFELAWGPAGLVPVV